MMKKPEISLRVPAGKEYALVLRLALGGVAILKDLDTGTLDDLRIASDECCDCLLHQGARAEWLELNVYDGQENLTVSISAEFSGIDTVVHAGEETEITRAVLETLAPEVALHIMPCGCVERIDLMLPKAVCVGE